MDNVPFQALAFNASLDSATALAANFELDFLRCIDEDAIAFVAESKLALKANA